MATFTLVIVPNRRGEDALNTLPLLRPRFANRALKAGERALDFGRRNRQREPHITATAETTQETHPPTLNSRPIHAGGAASLSTVRTTILHNEYGVCKSFCEI